MSAEELIIAAPHPGKSVSIATSGNSPGRGSALDHDAVRQDAGKARKAADGHEPAVEPAEQRCAIACPRRQAGAIIMCVDRGDAERHFQRVPGLG